MVRVRVIVGPDDLDLLSKRLKMRDIPIKSDEKSVWISCETELQKIIVLEVQSKYRRNGINAALLCIDRWIAALPKHPWDNSGLPLDYQIPYSKTTKPEIPVEEMVEVIMSNNPGGYKECRGPLCIKPDGSGTPKHHTEFYRKSGWRGGVVGKCKECMKHEKRLSRAKKK